jgi:integrase
MEPTLRIASEAARRLPKKLNFTIPIIKSLKVNRGRTWLYDLKSPGLALMATAAGSRVFYLCRRIDGRPERYRIGAFPQIGIETARTMATKLNGEIASGGNPQLGRHQRLAEMTFSEAFAFYMTTHSIPKKRTWREDQQKYDRHLAGWSTRKLTSITTEEVRALHAKIGRTAPGAANRTLSLLSSVFNVLRVTPNPCRQISKFAEHDRERFVLPHEFPILWKAIQAETELWRDFFTIALFTGARSGNVQSMRWNEISLEAGRWTIPAAKFKAARMMVVPLVGEVLSILKRRKAAQDARQRDTGCAPCEWVFPAESALGHVVEPKLAWERIRKASGLTDLRIHDLRRSMGSWQASTGANLSVIGKTLGHANTSTTAIYARVTIGPVEDAMTKAVGAMLEATKTKAVDHAD